MLDTDDRVALSSFGCYSRQDGSCTRVSRKSPAIWFLEAVCKRQQGGVRKSQASADLSLRFLRLTEDGGRISPVQVICSQRSGAISIGALTASHIDLQIALQIAQSIFFEIDFQIEVTQRILFGALFEFK